MAQELRWEQGVASPVIVTNSLFADFLLSIPAILSFACLEVLSPKGGDTKMFPLSWKLRLPNVHFGLLMSLSEATPNYSDTNEGRGGGVGEEEEVEEVEKGKKEGRRKDKQRQD